MYNYEGLCMAMYYCVWLCKVVYAYVLLCMVIGQRLTFERLGEFAAINGYNDTRNYAQSGCTMQNQEIALQKIGTHCVRVLVQ